ncbi:MAG TPA: tRNA (adenosine(37)-N6)-dimethylallyltransferase MiaA [Candidatus Kapabacteria bacterium]|nr:tRNA (adenosine(37)-N6)-dimethylallyltransferase MiaA [Candidatus Kapabacteria bacterium]
MTQRRRDRESGLPIVPVIFGPTCSGKTALALELAQCAERVEIVSADSRQIYLGMDIGTAKPSRQERSIAPHHFIDIVTPDTLYSAGRYAAEARACIADILERGGAPLVVGGSGFYIKALFEGLSAPTADPAVLERLAERGEREGYAALYEELIRVDPQAAATHSPNNHVKTLRALGCYYQTGMPYSSWLASEGLPAAAFVPAYHGIAPPRERLYANINARVHRMLTEGLLDEVRALLAAGQDADAPGLRTVGYAEALRYLRGELDLETMTALIQQSTRRYAKRQMTWFRRVENVRWMEQGSVEAVAL